jgi:hypothetical protein
MGMNARFYERKRREKSGRQSSLGNPSKVHPAFFIIPSHYIRFSTVNVLKSQGGIFTRVVPRGYIGWKRIQFPSSGII